MRATAFASSAPHLRMRLTCVLTDAASKCRLSSTRRDPGHNRAVRQVFVATCWRYILAFPSPNVPWSQGIRGPRKLHFQILANRLSEEILMHHFVAETASLVMPTI